jgi:general secretion pathway protein G
MKRNSRGFTLVEILIVVIILGILAAIVIPQFTNASNDARNNSVASTLQTMRSQIELYKIQHGDTPPAQGSLVTLLTLKTDTTGNTTVNQALTTGILGPYVQTFPTNPINGLSAVGTSASTAVGWVYTVTNNAYTVSAVNTLGSALTY